MKRIDMVLSYASDGLAYIARRPAESGEFILAAEGRAMLERAYREGWSDALHHGPEAGDWWLDSNARKEIG